MALLDISMTSNPYPTLNSKVKHGNLTTAQVLHADFRYSIETELIKFSKITVNFDIDNIFNVYIKCIVKVYHISFYDSKNTTKQTNKKIQALGLLRTAEKLQYSLVLCSRSLVFPFFQKI